MKQTLPLYHPAECKTCVCTICKDKCDRNVPPCNRCFEVRKPFLTCIEYGSTRDKLGRLKIVRGIVQDDDPILEGRARAQVKKK